MITSEQSPSVNRSSYYKSYCPLNHFVNIIKTKKEKLIIKHGDQAILKEKSIWNFIAVRYKRNIPGYL